MSEEWVLKWKNVRVVVGRREWIENSEKFLTWFNKNPCHPETSSEWRK